MDGPHAIEAVILAGSFQWAGSRFDELRPRPLLPVAHRPLLNHVLDWLGAGNIRHGVICGNGSTAAIRAHLSSDVIAPITSLDFHEDSSPRGAAGCVRDAATLLAAGTILVVDGTSVPNFDLKDLVAKHRATASDFTIVAHQRGADQATLHPAGIYLLNRKVLESVPAASFQDIKESLIPKLYRHGYAMDVFRVPSVSPRVLSATTYLALNHWMINRLIGEGSESTLVRPGDPRRLYSSPSASISPDALVVGPVMVGPNCRVHPGAVLVGPTAIGEGSVIEAGAVVARSVLWERCRVGARAVVDQCVLSDSAFVEPDASLATEVCFPSSRRRLERGRIARGLAKARESAIAPLQQLASRSTLRAGLTKWSV